MVIPVPSDYDKRQARATQAARARPLSSWRVRQGLSGTRMSCHVADDYSKRECFCRFIRNTPLKIACGSSSTVAVDVPDPGIVGLGSEVPSRHREARIQELVVVRVLEQLDAAVGHQDVARGLVATAVHGSTSRACPADSVLADPCGRAVGMLPALPELTCTVRFSALLISVMSLRWYPRRPGRR